MSDSDNDSVGNAAHADKARKGTNGVVAKLRQQFEHSTSQALALVPSRRSARVAAASQPGKTGKRCRSPGEPAESLALAGGASSGPADTPAPPSPPVAPAPSPAADAPVPTLTLEALLIRVQALEGDKADVQQLKSDLLRAQTDLAAVPSELAELKGSITQQLQEQTSHGIARETAVKDELRQLVQAEGSSLERLSQRVRANNIVMHGVPDTAAHSRPADLTRFVRAQVDAAAPRRPSTTAPHSQSIQAVNHIGRPGSDKRAVLVEFCTQTAKHEAFKLSPHLRRSGLHLADELTPKQLRAQKGLAADFSALKLKGFSPFFRRGELKYWDQGINRTCRKGEAIHVSAPSSPPRALPAPPRASSGPRASLGPFGATTAARSSAAHGAPGHPRPGHTGGCGPTDGQPPPVATSASAAIAVAHAATAAAAAAGAGAGDCAGDGNGDTASAGLPPPPPLAGPSTSPTPQ
ncbi:hypothetical protein ABBQ32_008810 [Trebouxia sp. C0010 RCD-2024]